MTSSPVPWGPHPLLESHEWSLRLNFQYILVFSTLTSMVHQTLLTAFQRTRSAAPDSSARSSQAREPRGQVYHSADLFLGAGFLSCLLFSALVKYLTRSSLIEEEVDFG